MTEDRWQNTRHLHLNLDTRTRHPTAETWDPKVFLPQPTIRSPLEFIFLLPATCHPWPPPATRKRIPLGQHAVLPLPRYS